MHKKTPLKSVTLNNVQEKFNKFNTYMNFKILFHEYAWNNDICSNGHFKNDQLWINNFCRKFSGKVNGPVTLRMLWSLTFVFQL